MSSIIDTAKSLLFKLIPSRKIVDQRITEKKSAERTTDQQFAQQPFFRIQDDTSSHKRLQTIFDCWRMYEDDDRVRSTIRGLSEDFVRRGVDRKPMSIKVISENKSDVDELQTMLDTMFSELKIYDRLDSIARCTLIEGSRYYRHVVDLTTNKIIAFKKLPSARNGFLITGPIESDDPQVNGGYVMYDTKYRAAVNFFYWWEIAAFHWDYDEDMGFGTPLFSSGRINYERLRRIERSMAKARERIGYNRLGFENLGFTNSDDFNQFVANTESMRMQKGDSDGMSDVYSNGTVRQINQANSSLFNIKDIEYSQAKMQESGLKPKALGGSGGENVNRAVLEVQYDDYINGTVIDGEAMLENGLRKTIEVQMALLGRDIKMTPVQFVWPSKHIVDARLIAEAREANKAGKLSDTTYLQMFKSNFERERKLIEQETIALEEEQQRQAERTQANIEMNEPNEDEIEIDDEENIDDQIESLLKRTNGRARHVFEKSFS